MRDHDAEASAWAPWNQASQPSRQSAAPASASSGYPLASIWYTTWASGTLEASSRSRPFWSSASAASWLLGYSRASLSSVARA